MPTVSCPNCQDRIEIDADWYGRRVACPSCDHRFTPRRPGDEGDSSDRSYRMVDRATDDEDEDDRPRRRSRPRSRSRDRDGERKRPRSKTTLVVVSLLTVLGLCCLGCGGWAVYWFTAPVKYDGPWVTQPLPDGSCAMSFPRPPKSEDLSDPLSGSIGAKYLHEEPLPKDAAFAFGYIDFPANQPGLFEEAYRLEMAELRKETGARVTREVDITVNGYPCKEAEFSGGGGRVIYRLIHVTDHTPPRMLVVVAGGRNVSEADRKKFLDSLTFTRRR